MALQKLKEADGLVLDTINHSYWKRMKMTIEEKDLGAQAFKDSDFRVAAAAAIITAAAAVLLHIALAAHHFFALNSLRNDSNTFNHAAVWVMAMKSTLGFAGGGTALDVCDQPFAFLRSENYERNSSSRGRRLDNSNSGH